MVPGPAGRLALQHLPVRACRRGPSATPDAQHSQAAARPDSNCDALYFVADGDGGHVFSRTAAEHEAAVRQYRRQRQDCIALTPVPATTIMGPISRAEDERVFSPGVRVTGS